MEKIVVGNIRFNKKIQSSVDFELLSLVDPNLELRSTDSRNYELIGTLKPEVKSYDFDKYLLEKMDEAQNLFLNNQISLQAYALMFFLNLLVIFEFVYQHKNYPLFKYWLRKQPISSNIIEAILFYFSKIYETRA